MTPDTTSLPEAEPTAAELSAAGTIRPLDVLPSPWIVKGKPQAISQPTLSALSPDQQALVRARANGTDEASINRALKDYLVERGREVRIRCGPGEGATETEREALSQMNQLRLLSEEHARIEAELAADVREHRTETGPDGKPVAVPVPRYQGDMRTAKQARLDQIAYEMSLVAGIQGEAELIAAQRADALKARELQSQCYEAAEIKRMGEALLREERLKRGAEAYAKHRRQSL